MTWFEVDRKGLAEIAKRRGMAFIVTEPIQNAWDEATSRVDVELTPIAGVPKARLVVTDDSPDGFRDMADSYVMFRPSYKISDPEKRGRFNIGEKLLLAVADRARITSTTGSVIFSAKGRTAGRKKTEAGSILEATLRMNRDELAEALAKARTLIPPVPTYVNGERLPTREPEREGRYALLTEIQGDEGGFRTTYLTTDVRIYRALDGEAPHLYEMGIPVCEVSCPWHVEVMQKVPLTVDRASVSHGFQLTVERIAAELAADLMSEDDSRAGWVSTALGDMRDDDAVREVVKRRFGKAVTYDPSNPESNKLALDAGYKVVHGGELSGQAWASVRRAEALKPAGQVFDNGRVETSPDGVPPVPRAEWDERMKRVAEYARAFAAHTCGQTPRVDFYKDAGLKFDAMCGMGGLAFNIGRARLKRAVRHLDQHAIDEVLIHECAHFEVDDHLTHEFHRECCRIGASARTFERSLS